MEEMLSILVIWRGKKLNVEINSGATLKEFGHKLQHLTNVKSDTLRLLIPRSSDNSSRLLTPFSDDHSSLSLKESSVLEGKSIRMMGVFEDEIKEVSQNGSKADLRIAGFDEEERRLRQRMLNRPKKSLKLPQGAYIFCDFRTLHLPGIELNPPASEALKRMHMLAADPGIVAIMNKHRWRVGVMTEMAPVGYVGVTPKCILGYNKNHGEEISLRLRTDDLKGFRMYESIKKTLLHELAHMVYSEHDAAFYALDKQLNQEAASLDWTKSSSHTLSGVRSSDHYEEEFYEETTGSTSQKLGGKTVDELVNARATSVAAAYRRLAVAPIYSVKGNEVDLVPGPDDSGCKMHVEPDPDDCIMEVELLKEKDEEPNCEADHVHDLEDQNKFEDHKASWYGEAMEMEPYSGIQTSEISSELNPDGREKVKCMPPSIMNGRFLGPKTRAEPDPDDSEASSTMLKNVLAEPDPDNSLANENLDGKTQLRSVSRESCADDAEMNDSMSGLMNFIETDPDDLLKTELGEESNKANKIQEEPNPDDSGLERSTWECGNNVEPDPDDSIGNRFVQHDDSQGIGSGEEITKVNKMQNEPKPDTSAMEETTWVSGDKVEHDPDDSMGNGILQREPDPDESKEGMMDTSSSPFDIPDQNDQELQRIQDPVSVICTRLQKTIEMLKSEVNPAEATSVLQTLFKIIRNVIEHPDEIKFRRLRKANPHFQRTVAKYKAAMEVLFLVGFNEDTVSDEIGRSETYVVLKRNDPGLLWLVKSSLEIGVAY